jgi:hypothetical protein
MARIRVLDTAKLERIAVTPLSLVSFGRRGGRVWQFTVLFPMFLMREDGTKETIFNEDDEDVLFVLLARSFGGATVDTSPVRGIGLRAQEFETNTHRRMTVLAARSRSTTRYFRALRRELEASSGEKQILILREELAVV